MASGISAAADTSSGLGDFDPFFTTGSGGFVAAVGLVFVSYGGLTKVASIAEEQQHHPEWSNVYNRVSIRLRTHDASNSVTEKDRRLAAAIESI